MANDEFKQLVKDITLQIAAGQPFCRFARAGAGRGGRAKKRRSPPNR